MYCLHHDGERGHKATASIPSDLLKRIDREAQVLVRGRAALKGIGGFKAAELIRADREDRDARDRRR
jgi:hypothetical protein